MCNPFELAEPQQPVQASKRRVGFEEDASEESEDDASEIWEGTSAPETSGAETMALSEFWQDITATGARFWEPRIRLSLSSMRRKLKQEEEEDAEEDAEYEREHRIARLESSLTQD